MALVPKLGTLPSILYRKDRHFYLRYDIPYLMFFVGISVALFSSGYSGITWRPWMWMLLPLVVHLHVLASVCIHNATHVNFPRAINRVVGEFLGVLLVVRFANWDVLHVRHHRYPDDSARDPHPMQPNFWAFLFNMMVVNLERQLQNIHYNQFGDSPERRRYERFRALLSFTCEMTCVMFWYALLGSDVFLFLFVPAQILGWIVVSHFNWVTHNGESAANDYHPINIDRGLYWFGNRIWFGLYMHKNHHERANIFNPLHMDAVLAARALAKADAA